MLFNSTTQKAAPEPVGVPEFETPTGSGTAARPGLDPATLFDPAPGAESSGRRGQDHHQGPPGSEHGGRGACELAGGATAISDCSTCHRAGADAFQSVVVSVAGPAGIPMRYGASKDVLSSAFSIQSIGGFYAIGGTRITFLDVLLVLALLGGIGGPIVHMTARWVFTPLPEPPAPRATERVSQMHRIYIHPLPVRIWHWTNAAGCVMLVLTGLQIRYVGLIDVVPFRTAVAAHNWLGFVIIANFFVWLVFYLFSDRIRVYLPELNPVKYFPRQRAPGALLRLWHLQG